MSKIKAVIFDMDGTILDSREFIYRAMEDVLRNHGIVTSREEIAVVTGKPIKAMYELLAPGLDSDVLELDHLAHHRQNLHLLSLYESVPEVLMELKRKGLKVSIFTGFDKTTYDRLAQFSLVEIFDTIVENTRYTAHKPDPEGLFVALDDLGISSPRDIVYVGDGISDMLAGKKANALATIGVTYGFSSETMLKEAGADYTINSLAELLPLIDTIEATQ